jgi:hypothetical protein
VSHQQHDDSDHVGGNLSKFCLSVAVPRSSSSQPTGGDMSIASYFSTMRGYANEMVAAGKLLDDDDVISYILNVLDAGYNSLIEQVNGMTKTISPETLYSWLLDTEA